VTKSLPTVTSGQPTQHHLPTGSYTRTYHDAQPSSRTKDLIDLVLIAELASLDAVTLRRAIETTFTVRGTHPVPATLPAPPPEWSMPFAELATTVGVPTDLSCAHTTAAELLGPILGGKLLNATWNIEKRQWI
jgi:hypothetical protein